MLPSAVNLAPRPTAQHCYRDPNPLSISPQSFIITTATSFLYCSHSSKHHNVETNSVALQHTRWSETNSSLATATEQWIRSQQKGDSHTWGYTSFDRRRRFWHATHDCLAPYVDIILHRGRFWAKSAALGSVRWWCFRSCWWCWAMWCGDDPVIFSSLPERRPTGSSWHLRCRPCA